MQVKTANIYGTISISEDAIRRVAGASALECYGVVELTSKGLLESIKGALSDAPYVSGVGVDIVDNKICLTINAVLKYGIPVDAIAHSIEEVVVYQVEKFTGMLIKSIKVNIVGVRL